LKRFIQCATLITVFLFCGFLLLSLLISPAKGATQEASTLGMSIFDVYVPVAEITSHSALVTWSTSSPASSQVFYDETFHVTPAEYGSCTDFESSLIRNHGIFLEGLEANKTYHFRVQSTANMGGIDITCYSDDYTFDTLYDGSIGGGGGGGGSSDRIFLAEYMNPPGTFGRDVSLRAYDGICTLIIPKGTVGKTPEGWALSYIILKPLQLEDEKPPSPQVGGLASRIYRLEPDGVTFSPAVTIYLLYKENEIPSGFGESDLRIGYWDKGQGKWVVLEGCKVDVEKNAVAAPLSHFSYYALLAVPPAPLEPTLSRTVDTVVSPVEKEEKKPEESLPAVTPKVSDTVNQSPPTSATAGAFESVVQERKRGILETALIPFLTGFLAVMCILGIILILLRIRKIF